MSNWVERKKARQAALISGASTIWNDVRAAIQDACASYNAWQAGSSVSKTVVCALENGKRIRLSKELREVLSNTTYHDQTITVVIEFHMDAKPWISVAGDGPVATAKFVIDADEKEAFIKINNEISSGDQVSEKILSPLLFPTEKYANIP